MKIQKKVYLSEGTAQYVREAAFRSGFSQSRIVEAALTLEIVRDAMKRRRFKAGGR